MRDNKKTNVLPYKTSAELYFRIGVKYEDEKKYIEALKYFIMAAKLQPFNADYQLNIAGVLTEIGDFKESNRVLAGILKNIDDSLSECYFCMACNYFDLGNLKKSASYFKKYTEVSPDGCFVDDAYNAIYYLELYDGKWEEYIDQDSSSCKNKRVNKAKKGNKAKIINLDTYVKDLGCEEPGTPKTDIESDTLKSFSYKWQQVINCAVYKKEPEYGDLYKQEIEDICMSIITKLSLGNKLVIRKCEVWAAVLEYLYCLKMDVKVTKTSIASKYDINTSSMSSKLKQLGL